MIIFGYGYGGGKIDHSETNTCPTCGKDAEFDFFIKYRYEHFYHLKWVTEKKISKLCKNCKHDADINYFEIKDKLSKNPIPFTVRYGWVLLAIIALTVVISGHILNHIYK